MDTISTNKNNNNDELSFQLLNNFNLVGFKNDKYENNCFVGVVFHSLFHFTELKEYLINLKVTINTPKLIIEIISLLNITGVISGSLSPYRLSVSVSWVCFIIPPTESRHGEK